MMSHGIKGTLGTSSWFVVCTLDFDKKFSEYGGRLTSDGVTCQIAQITITLTLTAVLRATKVLTTAQLN